jgi:DNA-binding transcriptional ArsR family regulator
MNGFRARPAAAARSAYAAEDVWYDNDAGPVVRLYAMTAGRTLADRGGLELITVVWAVSPNTEPPPLPPEQAEIMRLCQRPLSVSEIAAHLKLPLGSVRVLLSDLREAGLIAVPQPRNPADQPSRELLERVLSGLLAL